MRGNDWAMLAVAVPTTILGIKLLSGIEYFSFISNTILKYQFLSFIFNTIPFDLAILGFCIGLFWILLVKWNE